MEKWLSDVSKAEIKSLNKIGQRGVSSLEQNTPRDTGQTAKAWTYSIESDKNGAEIVWTNTASVSSGVNIAKLIELGHGTGTGGYVPPRPYIKQAMDNVLETSGDIIAKELIK